MTDARRAFVLAAYARHARRFENDALAHAHQHGGPRHRVDAPLGPIGRDLPPSRRQLGVLALIADGHSNRTIALKLGVSEATAKSHVKELAERFGSVSRAQTVSLGYRYGFLSPEPLLPFPCPAACIPGSAEVALAS